MASNVLQEQQQQCIRQQHQAEQSLPVSFSSSSSSSPSSAKSEAAASTPTAAAVNPEDDHQPPSKVLSEKKPLLSRQYSRGIESGYGDVKDQLLDNKIRVFVVAAAAKITILKVIFILLVLWLRQDGVYAEGNVGCHFVRTLCLQGREVCFDDNVFGKCIPTAGVDVEDIEKTPLTEEQSRTLATMLEELQGAGLGWDHPYVQCRIQGSLFSMQRRTQLPPNLCANLAPIPTDVDFDPAGAMAFVRFTPPEENVISDLYYPPPKKQTHADGFSTILRRLQLQERPSRHDPMELTHFAQADMDGMPVEAPRVMDAFLASEGELFDREQMQREAELEAERQNAIKNRLALYQLLAASEPDPQPYMRKPAPIIEQTDEVVENDQSQRSQPPEVISDSKELYFLENFGPMKRTGGNGRKQALKNDPAPRSSFFRELALEEGLSQEPIDREFFSHAQVSPPLEAVLLPTYKRIPAAERENNFANSDEDDSDDEDRQRQFEESLVRNSLTPFEEEAMLASNTYPHHKHRQPERVFTEGGLVYVPGADSIEDEQELKKEKARELLANMLGFTRHERLDVKKPGPLIRPTPSHVDESATGNNKPNNTSHLTSQAKTKEILPNHIKGSELPYKKKNVINNHSDEDHAPHSVDTEYAHVYVRNPIDSWNDGKRIVNELANVLHMQNYFTYLTVQPHEVSFRVNSTNPERKTASDIARAINENRGVKNNILRRLGVTVIRAGVGNKIKAGLNGEVSSAPMELAEDSPDVTHIMAYMFAGAGAAAVIVIFVTLILIKRHDKKRDKLGGLQTGIAGAESCSKDYQDLCRARMAGKGNAVEPVAGGRVTSLSKDNERPPSSRSSTSSWSEEPALTNMDISTGHMVLSYMEDHLRNKGRLQREWEALCRYEAEPSARDAALQPQCENLNRQGAPLPYDHSRVVLNHLANAEGLDYVNASTITDHDPRAPAYVAAQGPLPTTLAHFWQMIWEQGAVVIVALCRLQENGEIACARYWPEEGAEVYHIYEVHLVSEHIWCDDYLVRSFYLKNLRTSETRTVTQFHFLSWPSGGVPALAKPLLDFRRKVNKSYRGRSCPIVVHGSTGAGRTGAYILLDLVLGRMNKGAREIDIAATLEHLRDQRAGLVATRQQFEFVLMAVAEEVHAILKALPANQSNEKRDADSKDSVALATGTLKEEETNEEVTASTSKQAKDIEAKEKDKENEKDKVKEKDKDKEKEKEKDKGKATTSTDKQKEGPKSTPSKSVSIKKK